MNVKLNTKGIVLKGTDFVGYEICVEKNENSPNYYILFWNGKKGGDEMFSTYEDVIEFFSEYKWEIEWGKTLNNP